MLAKFREQVKRRGSGYVLIDQAARNRLYGVGNRVGVRRTRRDIPGNQALISIELL